MNMIWLEIFGKNWNLDILNERKKGMKFNLNEGERLYLCRGRTTSRSQACRYECFVCGKNATMCTICEYWVYKRCSKIQGSLGKQQNLLQKIPWVIAQMRYDIEIVEKFSYLVTF